MADFLAHLKQRKLVQWALAYLAAAWVSLQVLDLASGSYHWPDVVMHIAFGVLAVGFVITLLLAWYHGEQGRQRVSGAELLLIAMALAIGGGLLWHFARVAPNATTATIATRGSGTAQRNPGTAVSIDATGPVSSESRVAPAAVTQAVPIPTKSIAVLPFENLSTDKGNAYFADGMQDLILTKLADIGDLKVISRTSTAKYASHPDDLKTIGQQLGVATILEGSVQKAGNQVLINVQLIDAKTDSHIWAQSYQRNLTNIFGVEGEVADKVAKALNAKLTSAESARVARVLTTNPQAYMLYLKARHDMDEALASVSSDQYVHLLQNSIEQFKQAIALDPGFASAYANLAACGVALLNVGVGNESVTLPMAEAHAQKALSLQPDLAAGHVALAIIYLHKRDFMAALPEVQTAARLAPSDSIVVAVLAGAYRYMGKWQQAYDATHKAVVLDPRNGTNYSAAADVSASLRRYADARQMLERGLAVSPDNAFLHEDMGDLMLREGQPAAARTWYAQLPDSAEGKFADLAYAWALSRNHAQALKAAWQIPPSRRVGTTGRRAENIGRYARMAGDEADADTALTQARTSIQNVLQQISQGKSPGNARYKPTLYRRLARVEAESGHRDAALHDIDKATALVASSGQIPPGLTLLQYVPGYFELKAEVLSQFGDAKGATEILGKLFDTQGTGRVISVPLLKLDPVWDPIRKDPRFQALLTKYDNAQPVAASSGAAP
jgi:TolB-like protein/Tfp pilus assembly protein PilF